MTNIHAIEKTSKILTFLLIVVSVSRYVTHLIYHNKKYLSRVVVITSAAGVPHGNRQPPVHYCELGVDIRYVCSGSLSLRRIVGGGLDAPFYYRTLSHQ